jgi:hypothetical protein
MYFTLLASGFGAGGESAHALLGEVLATKLTRVQACFPISGVMSRHRDAMALFALSLARSLATALISKELLPAQAFSSPRRSSL